VSIFLWKQRWSRSPKKAAVEAEEKHREEVLEKLHAEELEMKEEWEAEDLRKDAFAGPDPTLKGKKAKVRSLFSSSSLPFHRCLTMLENVSQKDIKHKQKLQHDYNKRETTLKPLHDRAEERARRSSLFPPAVSQPLDEFSHPQSKRTSIISVTKPLPLPARTKKEKPGRTSLFLLRIAATANNLKTSSPVVLPSAPTIPPPTR
jgi:hypothetical protein